MKIPYTFSILRYVHDVLSGEFVNIGIVFYAPKARYISSICTSRYNRLSKMFLDVDGDHVRKIVRYIEARIEEEGERLLSDLPFEKQPNNAKDFVSRILPVDDSSLQFSPEGCGLTENAEKTLKQLYDRYVEKYYKKTEKQSRSDDEVWKIYKNPLEKKQLLGYLIPHQISGKNYNHEFKHCWKNDSWHINEPISFDLIEEDTIIDKAHVWIGRIESLVDGGEPFRLNVLLGSPSDNKVKLAFVKAQNILNKMPCKHEFIKEDEAESFAGELQKEIENSAHTTNS